ncbi:VanZ family protein [Poseidonibacter lekithochrous]|uniref:VanZ family protein n=1 Tax=Poseidonibacter TaxID=2321187 RepID=UPI001C0931B6|nr:MULTISPECIES: VanZ family protein [Poseidonibacter]MBU3015742.1 VanZ family protein [Poseidonibacter lekithochrous]MDO6829042.1 VanZ family protein [Poseidonibacter sp. 1_MG-2023]
MRYLFILALGLIVYISFNSTFINPYLFEGADKIKHFLAFFILSFLFFRSFEDINNKFKFSILALFAVLIEVIQSFVGREASVNDALASLLGIVLYLLIVKIIKENTRENL